MTTIDTFFEAAWKDHADDAAAVADRLATSLGVIEKPADLPRYVQLVSHVYGEHLARWDDGIALLGALRGTPHFDGSEEAEALLARTAAALRYGAGDPTAIEALPPNDRIAALCTAASALVAQKAWDRAAIAFDAGTALAAQGGLDARATRALAVAGNNTAAALEEKPDRSASETAAMLRAAQAGVVYWKQAGTWLEEERAEYRLARSLMQAGDFAAAGDAARRCIAVCQANDAPAFERFFGHAVIALAARGAGDNAGFDAARSLALACYADIPADERSWCAAELAELG